MCVLCSNGRLACWSSCNWIKVLQRTGRISDQSRSILRKHNEHFTRHRLHSIRRCWLWLSLLPLSLFYFYFSVCSSRMKLMCITKPHWYTISRHHFPLFLFFRWSAGCFRERFFCCRAYRCNMQKCWCSYPRIVNTPQWRSFCLEFCSVKQKCVPDEFRRMLDAIIIQAIFASFTMDFERDR